MPFGEHDRMIEDISAAEPLAIALDDPSRLARSSRTRVPTSSSHEIMAVRLPPLSGASPSLLVWTTSGSRPS
jgi:hypothetical protein